MPIAIRRATVKDAPAIAAFQADLVAIKDGMERVSGLVEI